MEVNWERQEEEGRPHPKGMGYHLQPALAGLKLESDMQGLLNMSMYIFVKGTFAHLEIQPSTCRLEGVRESWRLLLRPQSVRRRSYTWVLLCLQGTFPPSICLSHTEMAIRNFYGNVCHLCGPWQG